MWQGESWCSIGISGEEVLSGSGMFCGWNSKWYLLVCCEAMQSRGNPKDILGVFYESLNSREDDWFGPIGFLLVSHLLSIN